MNKVIIFDFNRTLFNPDSGVLDAAAVTVLDGAKAKGYRLVLLAQAKENRHELIKDLGLAPYFEEVLLVAKKQPHMINDIAIRHNAAPTESFVIGDRAHGEVLLGHNAGWHTIWLRAGRFADETPEGYEPCHTITQLQDALLYI